MRNNLLFIATLFGSSLVFASGGRDGGLTFVEASGARAAALGQAYTAAQNDITALSYNPASLDSLKQGHASFLYQKGLNDDSFGHLLIGRPYAAGSLGVAVGYYNAGSAEVFDGVNQRSVTAEQDLALTVGGARRIGSVAVGASAKFISVEIAETSRARAVAADLGAQLPVGRLMVGAALQNFGTSLKYDTGKDNLPRLGRVGAAYQFSTGRVRTSLLADLPYYFNQHRYSPGVGLEAGVGPISLRVGGRRQNGLDEISFGAGFAVGTLTFDYAVGLMQEFDAEHRVSLAARFGDPR